jgi:hypothetical protein
MQTATRLPVPVGHDTCHAPPAWPILMRGAVAGELTQIAEAMTSPAAHALLQPVAQLST